MQALAVLHARHNLIRKLSPNLGRLQSLRTLYLDHNKIEDLPSDLFNINHLRDLSVADNELDAIPAGMRKLFQLHHLSLARNWINNVDGRELHMLISLKASCFAQNQCLNGNRWKGEGARFDLNESEIASVRWGVMSSHAGPTHLTTVYSVLWSMMTPPEFSRRPHTPHHCLLISSVGRLPVF